MSTLHQYVPSRKSRPPKTLLAGAFGLLLLTLAPPAFAQPEHESSVSRRSQTAERASSSRGTASRGSSSRGSSSRGTATRSTPSRGSSERGATSSRGSSSRPERATRGGSRGPRHESSSWTRQSSRSHGTPGRYNPERGYRGTSHRHSHPSHHYSHPSHRYPSHHYSHRYPYYSYGHYYPRYSYPRYSFYFGLGYYFPYVSYHPYWDPYPSYSYRYRVAAHPQGAFDLDIRPKDTQVYLDGYYIGTVRQFDGWPRHLWLEEDSYELIFYKEGYQTVVREAAVRPEVVTKIKFRMQPGPTTPPEALTRYDEESRTTKSARYAPPYGEEGSYGGEERYGEERYDGPERYEEERYDAGRDLRDAPGRLRLAITPADASVYLDGEFIGIGAELSELASGLLIEPGEHRLEIFHPRHATVSRTVELTAGEETRLEIGLD